MKRIITILAPHFDDEFLGCSELIKKNHKLIKNIIFITDSHIEVPYHFSPIYCTSELRCSESYDWLDQFELAKRMQFLNIPDSFNYEFIYDKSYFYYKSFVEKYKVTPLNFWRNRILKLSGDIIVCPEIDDQNHAAHQLTKNLCIFTRKNKNKSIIYYNAYNTNKYHSIINTHNKEREFKKFYPDTYKNLKESNYNFNFDHEIYIYNKKEININLWGENG